MTTAAKVIEIAPTFKCGTINCTNRAKFHGYCRECFAWVSSEAEQANLYAQRREAWRAWRVRMAARMRRPWAVILGLVVLEYLAIAAFPSAFVRLVLWLGGAR